MTTENKPDEKKADQPWGGLKGVVVKGSITEVEKGVEGKVAYTKDGEDKEMRVVAYTQNKNAVESLKAAEASGAEMTLRGPWFGRGESLHLAVKQVIDPAAPKAEKPAKPELSDEEKAAKAAERAEKTAARAEFRVLVDADTVSLGDTVKKGDVDQEVNHIGDTFEQDGKSVAYAYFGDLGAEMAAKAEAKAAEKEAEDSSPSM